MEKIFAEINRLVSANGDSCNIRLSSDSHHIEKIKWSAHGFSLDYVQRKIPSSLSFSFRSIDTDRALTREYLASWGINVSIKPVSVLEDKLLIGADTFNIDYKNLVHPTGDTSEG